MEMTTCSTVLGFAAGCVAVVYSAKKHRQVRFFRASKGVSCVAYSRDGRYLAVGERGREVRMQALVRRQ